MESILQFMYLGEGRFYHERMGEFIKVAKDLEVKAISDGVEIGGEETVDEMEEAHRSGIITHLLHFQILGNFYKLSHSLVVEFSLSEIHEL